ncbi:MAG: class I SAM-dependent methyltransferase [Terriglobia bacterium]
MNGQGKPVIAPGCTKILDVGCGDGGALAESKVPRGALVIATDISLSALKTCRERFPSSFYVCSSAERLPYRSEAFDAYLARSFWPYTDLPKTTQEAARVLAPGGYLWVSTRTGAAALRWLAANWEKRYAHGIIFQLYVLWNGLMLHLTGRNFKFPFRWPGTSRYESFHTPHAVRHLLRRAGFDEIRITKRRFMEVTARKSPA